MTGLRGLPSAQLMTVVSVTISRITQVGTKVLPAGYLCLAPLASPWLTLVVKEEKPALSEGDEFHAQYPGPVLRWPCPSCAVPRLRSDRARGPHRTGLSCAGRGPGQPAWTLAREQPLPGLT